MSQHALVISARYFLIDLLGGIVFFPIWWYSRGLLRSLKFCLGSIQSERQVLAIGVWVKNLFVPMYGAYDIWGRIISFFMRLIQITGRLLFLMLYGLLMLAVFIAYLLLPVFVIWQFLFQATGVLTL